MTIFHQSTNYWNRVEAFRDWQRAAAQAHALGVEVGEEPTEATPWRHTDQLTRQMRNRIDEAQSAAPEREPPGAASEGKETRK